MVVLSSGAGSISREEVQMTARVDLHAHNRFSDGPDEWLLRRIGAPECFTEPLEVYRACRGPMRRPEAAGVAPY